MQKDGCLQGLGCHSWLSLDYYSWLPEAGIYGFRGPWPSCLVLRIPKVLLPRTNLPYDDRFIVQPCPRSASPAPPRPAPPRLAPPRLAPPMPLPSFTTRSLDLVLSSLLIAGQHVKACLLPAFPRVSAYRECTLATSLSGPSLSVEQTADGCLLWLIAAV